MDGPENGSGSAWRRRISGISSHLLSSTEAAKENLSHLWGGGQSASGSGIYVTPEIQKAIREGLPVVALESTIISHGMPWPHNLETAKQVEEVIRAEGAIPATIGIIEGVPTVGLSHEQMASLAQNNKAVRKASRRDLAYIMAKKLNGSTTVSATMFIAAKAGIPIFVTGGIGGVHRGGESTLDISADLTELGRTPVTVICAGVKSILDIPRTLEYLETQGACVAAYGSSEFPAFFSPRSGCRAPSRVESPEEAAALMEASRQLGIDSGIVIGVPIPAEFTEAGAGIERATSQALQDAAAKGITGNAITPFLLQRIIELTGGRSLELNMKLIQNNARIGARIAVAAAQKARA